MRMYKVQNPKPFILSTRKFKSNWFVDLGFMDFDIKNNYKEHMFLQN
jgi:hypothetical protein